MIQNPGIPIVQLTDATALDAKAEEAIVELGQAPRVQIVAAPGTGRRALLHRLEEKLGAYAVSVFLPPLEDLDAPLHGLLQAARALGKDGVEHAANDQTALRDRAWDIAQRLAAHQRCLLVWLPSSWEPSEHGLEPGAELRHRRAEDVLGGWFAASSLPVVLIMSQSSAEIVRRATGGASGWRMLRLEPSRVSASALENVDAWGAYAGAADSLHKALLRKPNLKLTPLQVRLLVGLIGLGTPSGELLDWFAPRQRSSYSLERRLCGALERPEHRAVRESVQRFLRARLPLPRDVAEEIAKVPEAHAPLLMECIASGGEDVQAIESVRANLLEKFGSARPDPATHLALADYHEKCDGARSPAGAFKNIEHWLEKAHHLGRSGPAGAERWQALELPTRELYWDRARSLSVEHRRYLDAAKLYRECINRFDDRDAYSWHYLGYNLDRAGAQRKDAEHAFRKAVHHRPDHPWYNSRLVTFLIDQARFREAEQEWQKALERLDPNGETAFEAPWLLREVHRWIVKAWLRFGEVRRAREVFDDIPEAEVDEESWFQELRQELEDAEEAQRLGESVYPSETPTEERWKRPEDVISKHDQLGRPLLAWFPGRIVAVDEAGVHAALATPAEDPKQQRLIARTLTAEEWQRHGFCAAREAEGRFILLAIYGDVGADESVHIFPVHHHPARFGEGETRSALRYLEGTTA